MLSRSINNETKELLAYKNQEGSSFKIPQINFINSPITVLNYD